MSGVGQRGYSVFSTFRNKKGFLSKELVGKPCWFPVVCMKRNIVLNTILQIPAEKEEFNPSSPASLCSNFLRVCLHSLIFPSSLPPNSVSTRRSEL